VTTGPDSGTTGPCSRPIVLSATKQGVFEPTQQDAGESNPGTQIAQKNFLFGPGMDSAIILARRFMKTKFCFLLGVCLTCSTANFPQARGTATTGSTNAPANPQAGPAASSDIGKFPNWDNLMKQGRAGDFFGGTVTVAGAALPWDPIPVNVMCDGKTRYTSTTDPKGNFLIAPKKTDDSAVGNRDTKTKLAAQYVGCSVQAVLAGFDSSSLTIANRNLEDDPNIGTITLKREEGSGGAAVSSTTARAPKDAMKAFDKARTEWLDNKPDKAQRDLEKAVQSYPQFAEAWYQLGRIQEISNKQEAASSFSKAVAADPKFILPYQRLAPLAVLAGKWQDVADYTSHELDLNPRGTPETWYYNALANVKLNKMEVAEASATKALAMDPLHTEPNTEQLLAVILAGKHDYAEALQHLRNCLTYLPAGPNADLVKQQITQLEPMVPQTK
jgi:tetratricopeptide (TPR) repeat protein